VKTRLKAPRPHYAEKFENGVFILKTQQMFSVHTTPEKLENARIIGHFRFVLEKNSGGAII